MNVFQFKISVFKLNAKLSRICIPKRKKKPQTHKSIQNSRDKGATNIGYKGILLLRSYLHFSVDFVVKFYVANFIENAKFMRKIEKNRKFTRF